MAQRQAVAGGHGSLLGDEVSVPDFSGVVQKHIALLAVVILSQADKARAIRVVLDRFDGERNIVFVV